MHEMAYAEGILEVALDVAEGAAIRRIQVRLGALHGIVPDSLRFCFQLAARDTPAAEAVLEVEAIAARVRCTHCGHEGSGGPLPMQCQACQAFDVQVVAGEEVLVDAVELDDGWRRRPEPDPLMEPFAREHMREHAASAGDH